MTQADPARILVVEDNEADVFLIKKALQDYKIPADVTVCEDGESAVRLLTEGDRSSLPQAIILDLNLPRVEGVEVLRKILNRPALVGVPVLIFTSSASPSDQRRAQILGASHYVQKPSTLDDFLRAVGENVREMLSAPEQPSIQ
ncbi:MAG TPA: response regulator [Bryobacteraceae bacterium]|nr:response regulator [Bryobacteraceae bacterium]